jgi:hypothetical protein
VDDQDRSVCVLDDGAGDAAEQKGAQTRPTSGAHNDHGGLLALSGLDDRLPDRAAGLDRERLGF